MYVSPLPCPTPLAGVHSVLVALLAEKADIQYDSELTDPSHLVEEIRGLGFGANLLSDSEGYQQGKLDLTVSAVISTTCMWSSHLFFVVLPCHYLHIQTCQ